MVVANGVLQIGGFFRMMDAPYFVHMTKHKLVDYYLCGVYQISGGVSREGSPINCANFSSILIYQVLGAQVWCLLTDVVII